MWDQFIFHFGRLVVATACCTFNCRNDLSNCHRASSIGFKNDTFVQLVIWVTVDNGPFWCNCSQNCCNMPIKQLDSSDRFYQNLFRSGRAFKSLQSSSIKMTMGCPFISSPWMVYPIWHSTVNSDLGKAVLADVASQLFVPQYQGLFALCSTPTWHAPFVNFGWKN